jgi:hypothetical protein
MIHWFYVCGWWNTMHTQCDKHFLFYGFSSKWWQWTQTDMKDIGKKLMGASICLCTFFIKYRRTDSENLWEHKRSVHVNSIEH